MGYKRRSNAEIMADTIAILLRSGVIARDDLVLAKIRSLTGIDRNELRRAVDRIKGKPTLSPTKVIYDEKSEDEWKNRSTRPRTTIDGVEHLRCTGGAGDEPHWAPETEFAPKPEAPWRRMSKCDAHRLRTQRARRISTDAAAAFDEADLDILYDDDNKPIGIECRRCGSKVGCACPNPSPATVLDAEGTAAAIDVEDLLDEFDTDLNGLAALLDQHGDA